MSKRDLKKYLSELSKEQLEEQVLDLYARFKQVKTFYNFVFKPKEDKLSEEARFRISKEYFPLTSRKPKARRSVAQKMIRHFIQLGVDDHIIADIMLYNIETAQRFSKQKPVKQDSFFISIFKSFEEAVEFIVKKGIEADFSTRLDRIVEECNQQQWMNAIAFENCWKFR